MDYLRTYLHNIHPISDEIWNKFSAHITTRRVMKSELILKQGEVNDTVCYVVSGCFRFYIVNEHGKEANKGFAIDQDLMASMTTLNDGSPCAFFVEALADSTLLQFRWGEIEHLPYSHRVKESISQSLFKWLERRQEEFLLDSPEQRYLNMLEHSPELCSKITDQHIAAFLGMTPVHLSRIKRKLRKLSSS